MANSAALNTPFEKLLDETSGSGLSLPKRVQQVYAGDWVIPQLEDRPYTYSNFVLSHDGRISFNEPGHYGGGEVSGDNQHDKWLMALLRARADAIMVGDNTLKLEPDHVWTHEFIFPGETANFHELRSSEGRARYPLQVFLSLSGEINWSAKVFSSPDYHVLIATTTDGATRVNAEKQGPATIDVIAQNHPAVDLRELAAHLHRKYQVKSLLVEGGPRAYGSAIADRIIDDEFLTLSPIVVGNDRLKGKNRPGLYEGIAFMPDNAVRMVPVSIRRHGELIFLRSRCIYPDDDDTKRT